MLFTSIFFKWKASNKNTNLTKGKAEDMKRYYVCKHGIKDCSLMSIKSGYTSALYKMRPTGSHPPRVYGMNA